jgi:hypothetical protein
MHLTQCLDGVGSLPGQSIHDEMASTPAARATRAVLGLRGHVNVDHAAPLITLYVPQSHP